jgi:hypothetical protein
MGGHFHHFVGHRFPPKNREYIGKNGQKPVFSSKSQAAFPKAEVLGKPQLEKPQ